MSIAPDPAAVSKQPRRRGTMRSFRWPLTDRAEISACPDCVHWHAVVEDDADDGSYSSDLYLREWHEADCPCWEGVDAFIRNDSSGANHCSLEAEREGIPTVFFPATSPGRTGGVADALALEAPCA